MIDLLKYSVGTDISKDKFDACFSVIDSTQRVRVQATRKFENTIKGIKLFIGWILRHQKEELPTVIIMESTGVYYEKLAFTLYDNKFDVSVVLPNRAKKYIQSLGFKSKNDAIDAKALAQMGAEQRLATWQPYSKNIYSLRSLTRQNEDLQKERTVINNRLEAQEYSQTPNKVVIRQQKAMLRLIDKQITQVKDELNKCIEDDPVIKERCEKLETIKGVGRLTVATIVAETNGFILFKNQRQLVSFAGYDIVENQSGKHNGKTRISKKGNAHIRRALHMPSFVAVQYCPETFGALYERVFDRTSFKMKGYVAVQRKLLVLMYTLWRKNEVFNPNFRTSDNEEQKHLFSDCSEGIKKVPA